MITQNNETETIKETKIMEEPKIGEVVVTYSKDLGCIHIKLSGITRIGKRDTITKPLLKNYITLLRYEGNGIFTEYYTQKNVIFFPNHDSRYDDSLSSFAKECKFLAQYYTMNTADLYDAFSKFPIIVSFFKKINDEDKFEIGEQELSDARNYFLKYFEEGNSLFEHERSLFLQGNEIVNDFEKGITRKLEK